MDLLELFIGRKGLELTRIVIEQLDKNRFRNILKVESPEFDTLHRKCQQSNQDELPNFACNRVYR